MEGGGEMKRELATIILNKLVDNQILQAKETVEKEIEKAIDDRLAETKAEIMRAVDYVLDEKILTGREAIIEVLERAARDTDFMALLAEDPGEGLAGYGLTPEEKAAISSGDINQIEEWVGKLTQEQSTWLWARLQQEKW